MAIFNVHAKQFYHLFSETSMTLGVFYALHLSIITKLLLWACSKVWLMIHIILVFFIEVIEEFFNTTWRSRHNQSIQSTVSRSCGPSLLVLRTLEHYFGSLGVKVLQTPLGGEKICFCFISQMPSPLTTKCYLCINKHLFIYIYIYIYI